MNYHDVLGVSPKANKSEIKRAYHKLCLIYHPDKGGDHNKFLKIKEAYEALSTFDPNKIHHTPPENKGFVRIVYYTLNNFNGSIAHEVLSYGVSYATTDIFKGLSHTWRFDSFDSKVISISKKFLIACNYRYKIYFYMIDGSIIVQEYAFRDPRNWFQKSWDKLFN